MKIVRHIPNTITSLNLLCGVMGIIFTFEGRFDIAFLLMLAAAVCDFCDGLSARLLNAYSPMGKELDSLADLVSFGTLPGIMMHRLMIEVGCTGLPCYIPLIITVFSALRLARFNIDERQTEHFIGLATPACAMICGSFAYYICNDPSSIMHRWAEHTYFIPVCSAVLSLLLVSGIPMFSMKFKKNPVHDTPLQRMRVGLGGVIFAFTLLTILLGLNWSFIVLMTFVSYIIMNIGYMLIFRRKPRRK